MVGTVAGFASLPVAWVDHNRKAACCGYAAAGV
jgi:hypothetical protein